MKRTSFLNLPSQHAVRPGWQRLLRLWAAFVLLASGTLGPALAGAQTATSGSVYVAEIHGEIDLGVAPYLRRVLREAEGRGAAVVLDINTPGGRLDAALDMKDALLDSPVRTIAFVNRQAYSAGALIAIATNRIYMTPGGVIGAATPVTGTGETADEKIVSAVRSAFRSVAEARGLDPQVAEAMVDPTVEVPGLVDGDSLLTLTTQQAVEWRYAAGSVADLNAVLAAEGLEGRPLVRTSPGFAEALVRFITNPVVASLLITIGFLGLLYELQSPGFGLGGAVGLSALALFFGGHLVAGLAGWEGIALVVVGVALIALEVFLIPGFGVAGILGIIALLAGVYMSLIGSLPTSQDYTQAALVVGAAFLLMLLGGYLTVRFLPKRTWGGIVLSTRLRRWSLASVGEEGPGTDEVALPAGSLAGAQGTAITDLHPAGAASIDGQRIDVVAEEGYIAAGSSIEVVQDETYRRVVRALGTTDQPTPGKAGKTKG